MHLEEYEYIVWVDYGLEGWKPKAAHSLEYLEHIVRYETYGCPYIITRPRTLLQAVLDNARVIE